MIPWVTECKLYPRHHHVAVPPGSQHRMVIERGDPVRRAGARRYAARAAPRPSAVTGTGDDHVCRPWAAAAGDHSQVGVPTSVKRDRRIGGVTIAIEVDRVSRPALPAVKSGACPAEVGALDVA